MLSILVTLLVAGVMIWLVLYMLAQKPVTSVQQLIQSSDYDQAVSEADRQLALHPNDSAMHLHRAEALKLLGRFDEAIEAFERSDDPAAREGIALALARTGRDLDRAQRMMEETMQRFPQIQEFQALGLAYILLRSGDRVSALRLFADNAELLETRFRDDYTDRDPLLSETLHMYAELTAAQGDDERAATLRKTAARWAPGSVWAR